MSWGELAKGSVRPSGVVVLQVLSQHLSQALLVEDQQLVEDLPAQGADHPLAIAFASGACGGLATILVPSATSYGLPAWSRRRPGAR